MRVVSGLSASNRKKQLEVCDGRLLEANEKKKRKKNDLRLCRRHGWHDTYEINTRHLAQENSHEVILLLNLLVPSGSDHG